MNTVKMVDAKIIQPKKEEEEELRRRKEVEIILHRPFDPSFFRPSSILDLIMGINVAVNRFLRMNIVCEIQYQQSI